MKNLLKIYILFTLFIFVFIPCVNSRMGHGTKENWPTGWKKS